ncbi:hypothetical protein [Demequina sp.]|uniref:hypothetical protein n=1 Tax=Demequina sp. TaxID=2050685 RepID=UPI003D0F41F6
MPIDLSQLSIEPIRVGRARVLLDGHLIGWAMVTTYDGHRRWSVSTLVPWQRTSAPTIHANSAQGAVDAWAEWVNRTNGNPVDTRPNVSGP